MPPQQAEEKTRYALDQYGKALCDRAVGEGPAAAFNDLLDLCRREGISSAIIVPPESSAFRCAYRGSGDETIQRLAIQFGVQVFDARTWVKDDGFLDGHHLSRIGADQFTERFAREVLKPLLSLRRLRVRTES